MTQLTDLPAHLPVPEDDGACDHLFGLVLPSMDLPSTTGELVNLAALRGWVVVYCYPMTGQPGKALPDGWDQIPGARGCTPQSCAFRDHNQELKELQAAIFGLSTQSTVYQQEAADRLHLQFALLSDQSMSFSQALKLPVLKVEGMDLIKRLTIIAKDGEIVKVFYPVFPPEHSASTKVLVKNGFAFQEIVQDHEIGDAWLWIHQKKA